MSRIVPIARNQFLVTVKDLETYWETFSGINEATQTSEYSDGYSNRLFPLLGPRSIDEITLTKAYDPDKDQPIIDFWQNFRLSRGEDVNSRGLTVTVQPVEYAPDPQPIGAPFTLYGFVPTRFNPFGEVDKKSQDMAMMSLVGRITDWSRT